MKKQKRPNVLSQSAKRLRPSGQKNSSNSKSLQAEEMEESFAKSEFKGVQDTANLAIILMLLGAFGLAMMFFCGGDVRYGGYKNNNLLFMDRFCDALPHIIDSMFFVSFSTFLVKVLINIETMGTSQVKPPNPSIFLVKIAVWMLWAMLYSMIYMLVRPLYSIGEAIIFGIVVLLTWIISL